MHCVILILIEHRAAEALEETMDAIRPLYEEMKEKLQEK